MTQHRMTRRSFLANVTGSALASGLLLPGFAAAASRDEWSFGIIPDTQWKPVDTPPFSGVAIHVIDAMNRFYVERKTDLVLAVGDMTEFASVDAFETRLRHNADLVNAGIPFYPLRGNHDYKDKDDRHTRESLADYREHFLNPLGFPNEDIVSSPLDHAGGLTYSFVHRGIKFIMLDTFIIKNEDSEAPELWQLADQLPWIRNQLETNDYEYALVLGHKNLVGLKHKDNLFSDDDDHQDSFPQVQNEFFELMKKGRVLAYLSGHDHMYNHSLITSPNGENTIDQIICGNGSHKFYTPKPPFLARQKTIKQELNRIGFVTGRVAPDKICFEYYSTEPFGEQPTSPSWQLVDNVEIPFSAIP